jgi:hypothetical protein
MKIRSIIRATCGVAAALVIAAPAFSQAATKDEAVAPTFALLSLVGDRFNVVFRREEIGSHLDPNDRREFAVADATLDDIAVAAAEDVLKRLKPVSPVLRFSIRDPRLFALQDELLVDSGDSHAMREALGKLLREHAVSRLVLITKWRDDAQFKLYNGLTGTGKISGLGFYVDSSMRLTQLNSGESTHGFLGPYAFISVTVVDAASLAPIRTVPAREGEMKLPLNDTGAVRAWDALAPAGKVDALERVLRRAVTTATAAALAD